MSGLPIVSAKTMINYLKFLGFKEIRQRGSHKFFKHDDGRTATVPFHQGEDLGKGLISKILNDIESTKNDFVQWLNS